MRNEEDATVLVGPFGTLIPAALLGAGGRFDVQN